MRRKMFNKKNIARSEGKVIAISSHCRSSAVLLSDFGRRHSLRIEPSRTLEDDHGGIAASRQAIVSAGRDSAWRTALALDL